ncbi:hypothetical protein [Exiguobacterium artemiae]|uniref:hypothetical protein n=1 Tax=Exiguobacterium artemiae TaxID=340145 RepID=UPI00190F851C|nr:hypothetical protein [Exiguobacterium sibiricum]
MIQCVIRPLSHQMCRGGGSGDVYVKQDGGSGHSLAISLLILDSHGLTYGVRESALGGACFYVCFKEK